MFLYEASRITIEGSTSVALTIQINNKLNGINGNIWKDQLYDKPTPNYIGKLQIFLNDKRVILILLLVVPPKNSLSNYVQGNENQQYCGNRETFDGEVTGLQVLLQVYPKLREDVEFSSDPNMLQNLDIHCTPEKLGLEVIFHFLEFCQ